MRVNQKDITISIFELSNEVFNVIGQVNQYTSLRWVEEYSDTGSFELWAPITDENASLFKHDRLVWIEGEPTAGIIEGIKETVDTNEEKVYDITGRMLSSILDRRIVWNTYNAYNKLVPLALREIVDTNCINVEEGFSLRVIPYLELGNISGTGWGTITIQRTGDELIEVLKEISNVQESGFNIGFDPRNSALEFNVFIGENHAIGQDNPVVLSSSMEDILESTYYSNKKDYKNIALVAGEGEGEERVRTITGDYFSSGLDRRELYVDARDLQSGETEEPNSGMTPEEYNHLLISRGNEKLADCQMVEQFEATIRTIGSQYVYLEDYNIGDIVTVQDERLGISIDVRVVKVEQSFSDNYDLLITFGYDMPKLLRKLKTKNL